VEDRPRQPVPEHRDPEIRHPSPPQRERPRR
jgi:hypothetical protein